MAVMSDADRSKAARIVARKLYGELGQPGTCMHTDILNGVIAFDVALEGTAESLPGSGAQSIALRLNQTLPEPVATQFSVADKAVLFGVTIGVKYGWIVSGGD